jgi:hypothetical protein
MLDFLRVYGDRIESMNARFKIKFNDVLTIFFYSTTVVVRKKHFMQNSADRCISIANTREFIIPCQESSKFLLLLTD